MSDERPRPAPGPGFFGLLARIAALMVLVVGLHLIGTWLAELAWLPVAGETSWIVWIALAALYVLVMAVPFVPGMEIGLALMFWLGTEGIVLVYLCTQVALSLSFFAGRRMPPALAARLLRMLGLDRAGRWLEGLDASSVACADVIAARCLPNRWRRAWAYRYLSLAVVLNLPGNVVLGGAGGLGWIAGASRLFDAPCYVLTMAIATTPVPLALLLAGTVLPA